MLRSRGRLRGGNGGGVGTPFVGMRLGYGFGGPSNYGGVKPWANIITQMNVWNRISGTATFSQRQGELTSSDSTSEFEAGISTSAGMPAGTYTVLNPNGCNIKLSQGYSLHMSVDGYTTSTQWTFDYDPDDGDTLSLFAKGSVSGVKIIMPGCLTSFQAGDIFNPEWIAYQEGLSPSAPVRFMDWSGGAQNIEEDWADRQLSTRMSYTPPSGGFAAVPWDIIIETANRLNRDAWINVPYRATQDYVDELAALFEAELNPGLKVYVETGNECWNSFGPYGTQSLWFYYGNHTRHYATFSGGVFTKTAHGLSNDTVLRLFSTFENAIEGIPESYLYPYSSAAGTAYVEVLTANTFKLWTGAGATGTQLTFVDDAHYNVGDVLPVSFYYIRDTETTASGAVQGETFGELSHRNWLAFDAAFGGETRVKAVLGTQAASQTITRLRLDPDENPALSADVANRCDYLSGAPYFYASFFGGQVDVASGQFTPKAWTNAGQGAPEPITIHFGVYASGSTPTLAEVIAGTGTGFVGKTSFTHTENDNPDNYKSGSAVTGLSNGTTYACRMVFVETNERAWMVSQNLAASASASTVDFHDTYENMKTRCILNMQEYSFANVEGLQEVIAACPNPDILIANYEGGMHLDETNGYVEDRTPEPLRSWMINFTESEDFADALDHYYYGLAALDVHAHCIFVDLTQGQLSWTLATDITDLTDPRYVGAAAFNGRVPKRTRVSVSSDPVQIATDPGAFPYTVTTLTSGLTYTIVGGNNAGNYTMDGNVLKMVADTGVNWGAPETSTLEILATDGYTDTLVDLEVTTGDAWYAADAIWAWDPATDTNTAAVNPETGYGSALGTQSGTGGGSTYDTDGWLMNNTGYSGGGMQSSIDWTEPVLIAVTVDRRNEYGWIAQFSTTPISIYCNANIFWDKHVFKWRVLAGGVSVDTPLEVPTWSNPDDFNVMWFLYNPSTNQVTLGQNQTSHTPVTLGGDISTLGTSDSPITFQPNTLFKLGQMQVVNRAGMTEAAAKAIVQSMQDAQGIA
jgi:hypothetical protein